MENASKALIMAAGVLIGILILSLAIYLFATFGANSAEIYNQIEEQKLVELNSKYTVYNRSDLQIYDIVTVTNLARENNSYYKEFSNFNNDYEITVNLKDSGTTNLTNQDDNYLNNLIGQKNAVNAEGETVNKYKCEKFEYRNNGRVESIEFTKM